MVGLHMALRLCGASLRVCLVGLSLALSACGDSAPLAEVPAPPTERQTPVMRCAPAADGTAVAAAEAEGCAISSPERLS